MPARLKYGTSISLDGFTAGKAQSVENPLGIRGDLLLEWLKASAAWRSDHGLEGGEVNASSELLQESRGSVGALIMGRNMFGGGPGPWGKNPWKGWWGDNPPFHLPIFVLTHFARDPLELEGGNTFTFVTEGIISALEQARRAANGKDVSIGGGATVAKQYLAAGLLDELSISLVPVLLGEGVRLFDVPKLTTTKFEKMRVVDAPGVTHTRYRVVRGA